MNQILRKIKGNLWATESSSPSNDLLIKLVKDLRIESSRVSIFLVSKEEDIDTMAIALISSTHELKKFEYLLMKEKDFPVKKFKLEKALGDTPVDEANALHRNVVLSKEEDSVELVRLFFEKGKRGVIPKDTVEKLLKEAKDSGVLVVDRVPDHNMHLELKMECKCFE